MTTALMPRRAAILAAFAIVGSLNASYILNHFLVDGAYLFDSGWWSGMFERRGGLILGVPTAISGENPSPFWATHFPPTLLLMPAVQSILHIPATIWFAIVLGLIYGLLALSICWLLVLQTPASARWAALSLCGALAFSFSRPVLSAIGYPHFEFLFISLVLLFGIAFYHGRTVLALVLLALAIGVREDCGFHFFAVTATYLVLIRLTRPWTQTERQLIWFALFAFCWSVIAIIAQRAYFPGDNALARIYLGNPAFAHITPSFIAERVVGFARQRFDALLFWGWLIALAAVTRSLVPLAGFLAFIPWTILSLLAIADGPSKLGLYYGYPLVLGFIWPLLDRLWQRRPTTGFAPEPVGFIAISLLVAFLGFGFHERLGVKAMVSREWTKMSGTWELTDWLEASKLRKGVFVDSSVASLAPWRVGPQQLVRAETPAEAIKVIVYNPNYVIDRAATEAKANAAGLSFELPVPNSKLVVRAATKLDKAQLREALVE